MKKIVYVFVFVACFVLYACKSDKIKVVGNIKNGNGKLIYLKELAQTNVINTDSVKIAADGSFELKGNSKRIAYYMLWLSPKNYITLVISPSEKVQIYADAQSLDKSYEVKGSKNNALIRELTAKLEETLAKIDKLRKIHDDSIHSVNIIKIREQLDSTYDVIEREHRQYSKLFIAKNIESPAVIMALYQQLSPRTAVFNPTTHYHIFKMVDSVMMLKFHEIDATQSLHALINDVADQQKRKQELESRIGIGVKAPEIVLPGTKGEMVKLSSTLGKWVYLEFWASWCEPCRKENPLLLTTFWRYKAKGFTVFQVSLDKSKESWLKAIADDNLSQWQHCSDLQMWNSAVVPLYGIEAIPTSFLLNTNGTIVMKNIKVADLKIKLKEVFGY